MDEQSGETKEKEVIDIGIGELEIEELLWYQNEVDEEMKGFLERLMLVAKQE